MRRILLALVLVASFAVLAWLYSIEWPGAGWVVPGGLLLLLVAAAMRVAVGTRRRIPSAHGPAVGTLGAVQDTHRPSSPAEQDLPSLVKPGSDGRGAPGMDSSEPDD